MIHDAEQISCVFPYDNNDDDNTNFDVGDDKNDIPKHNNDKAIIIAPINEVIYIFIWKFSIPLLEYFLSSLF